MKIAVVAPTEIPARRANTLQVMKMTQALAILGHEVRLAVPGKIAQTQESRLDPSLPDLPSSFQWDSLARQYGLQREFKIERLPAIPSLRRYDFGLHAVRWARGWGANMIYTRLPQTAAIASSLNLKTVYEVHDLPQGTLGPWLLRRFLRGRGAWKLVVITRALEVDLAQQFGAPDASPFTLIAPDGVDLERFSGLPAPSQARLELAKPPFDVKLQPARFTVGYTGHLYEGRGIGLILELARRLPDICFLIVGGEPQDVDKLRAEINQNNLNNVLLMGFVPNADLPCYQAACDILLMPYQKRVTASSGGDIARYLSPMKLFEYLACGRPIISSDLPVLREVLTSRNAVLLSPDDVQAWANAVRTLQADPQWRENLAAQGRQDASAYTWEARAQKIFEEDPVHPGKGRG